MLTELTAILFGTALFNNIVLLQFLDVRPMLGGGSRFDNALALSAVTAIVLLPATIGAWLLQHGVLEPLGLGYLQTLVFLLLIVVIAQCTDRLFGKFRPLVHAALGTQVPLIAANCLVLGVTLQNSESSRGLLAALCYGIGAAGGFALALILLAALRERIDTADIPQPFRGASIALISVGLLALAFMGFTGLV